MKQITVYDYDDDRIDELCERYNLRPHELIEILLDNCDENDLH